jgi:hypothetical protein
MTPHEVIRKILDAATVTGRLEDAITPLDEYAEEKAIAFGGWLISTARNRDDKMPPMTLKQVYELFKEQSIKQQP